MKGKLTKKNDKWEVVFIKQLANCFSMNGYIDRLPLHPDDVKQIEEDSKRFDNIEARIAAQPDVTFFEVEECPHYSGKHFNKDCSCKTGFITYARLSPIISDDFQIGPDGAYEHTDAFSKKNKKMRKV